MARFSTEDRGQIAAERKRRKKRKPGTGHPANRNVVDVAAQQGRNPAGHPAQRRRDILEARGAFAGEGRTGRPAPGRDRRTAAVGNLRENWWEYPEDERERVRPDPPNRRERQRRKGGKKSNKRENALDRARANLSGLTYPGGRNPVWEPSDITRARASRPDMPGAALHTAEAQAWKDRMARNDSGSWLSELGMAAQAIGMVGEEVVDVLTGIPTLIRDPSWENAGWSAAGVIPGARGVKRGMDAFGFVDNAKTLRGTRTQAYRDLDIQMPSSPSSITANVQRVLDPVQERLGRLADELFESDSAAARAFGRAITPVSSRGRVPKRAGKLARWERERIRAYWTPELKTIGRLKRLDRSAAWWYAQLPDAYRNADGLRLVRNRLAQNVADIKSGNLLRQLETDMRAAMEAGDEDIADALGVRILDLDRELRDLGRAIKKMDTLIAKNPKIDPGVIDAVQALMDDREMILDAYRLLGDTAADRPQILADWIGRHNFVQTMTDDLGRPLLDRLGNPVTVPGAANFDNLPYVGHRSGKVLRQNAGITTAGYSTGKSQLPEGVRKQNQLVLANTGRIRDDIRVVLEDWQAAQVYDFGNLAKRDLSAMGEPVLGALKPGYVLINPAGRKIPKTWRVDIGDQLRQLGYGDDVIDEIGDGIEDILDTFATDKEIVKTILEHAKANGYYKDLRQVPEDLVERYFGQLVSPKAIRNVHQGLGRAMGRFGDTVNNIVYGSLIYSNPGYVPANLAGNAVFATLQQGAFMPLRLMQAGSLLAHAPARLRAQIVGEVGQGATVAAASGNLTDVFNRGVRATAKGLGHITDTGPRVSAFLHEARRSKVISNSPMLTTNDYKQLDRLMNDPTMRPILNDIREAAVQAMVDFERLGPWERSIAKRFLFVWPWIRGATAYPVRFAMDHPLRSAALGYVAAGGDLPESLSAIEGGRDAIFDRRMEDMPPWLREAYQVGETVVDGETFPSVLNTGPLSPVSTAYDTVASALGLAGSRNLWEMTNPGIQAGQRILSGETPWGQETGRIEAITSNLERLVPNIGLVGGLINPEGGGLYPEDATRLGRLKRAMRIFPYAIDPDEAFEAAVREGTAEAKKTPKRDPRADDLAWIKKHPEVIHPSYAPYAERYQRLYNAFLASKKALANKLDLDSVEQLGRRREYAIKLGVLMRDRPELFRDAPRSQYWEAFRSYFDLGVTDATGHHLTQEQERMLAEYTGWINSVFQFEDVLGAKIETIVDRARAEVDAKIANSVVVGG